MTYDKARQQFDTAQKAVDDARTALNRAKSEAESAKTRQQEAYNVLIDEKASYISEESGYEQVKQAEKAHKTAKEEAEKAEESVTVQGRVLSKRTKQLDAVKKELQPLAWKQLRKKAIAEYRRILEATEQIKSASQNLEALQAEYNPIAQRPGRIVPRNGVTFNGSELHSVTPSVFRDALTSAETETQ